MVKKIQLFFPKGLVWIPLLRFFRLVEVWRSRILGCEKRESRFRNSLGTRPIVLVAFPIDQAIRQIVFEKALKTSGRLPAHAAPSAAAKKSDETPALERAVYSLGFMSPASCSIRLDFHR